MPWNDRTKRRLKLRELDILMAVVQAGGMGKAARRLNTSQPVVSKAIADLEESLGFRLVVRSQKGIEPTPYGLALVKRGVSVFNELRQGVQDIEFLADPASGELRIGATEPVAAAIVAPIIDRLSRQYPRTSFQVVGGDLLGTYRNIAERNVELLISRVSGVLPEGCIAETLFHDSMVVAASAKHPLARRRNLGLADLVDESWTQQLADNHFGWLVENAFRACGLAPPRLALASSYQIMRNELLATGRFLTVVPGFTLKLPRKHPFLRALPVELPDARHPIAIITLKNRELSPLAQIFCERVRALTKPLANDRRTATLAVR
jgi:DNA-binding transcriptional LysR family regulator